MSDVALENAVKQRDELLYELKNTQHNLNECKRQLIEVEEFIHNYYVFAGIPNPYKKTPDPTKPKVKRVRANSSKEEVTEAAYRIIAERGEPMSRVELYDVLVHRGYKIVGINPLMVLSTMLWRMRHRIIRLSRGRYWLADVPPPTSKPLPKISTDDIAESVTTDSSLVA